MSFCSLLIMTDSGPIMVASMLFSHDHVRANRYYHIDDDGLVSFSLKTKQRHDNEHDIVFILQTEEPTILGKLTWN